MNLYSLMPSFRPKVMVLLYELEMAGIRCLVTSCRRTLKEQDALYEIGRSIPGDVVTKARGGQSPHNFGMAIDLVPLDSDNQPWWDCPDDVWQVIALTAEKNGLKCGYRFTNHDAPHVEDPHWKEQQALWKEGKVQVA